MTGKQPTVLGFSSLSFIHQDVLYLLALRETHKQLFNEEADVEVLNSTAPTTFSLVQKAIREAALLGITRLLVDPADRGGFKNLCLEALVINTPGDNSDILERLNRFRGEYGLMRLLRNKVYAHRDEATVHDIVFGESPLLEVEDADLWKAVDSIVEIVEELYSRIPFMNCTFADFGGPDGDKLIASLRNSIARPSK